MRAPKLGIIISLLLSLLFIYPTVFHQSSAVVECSTAQLPQGFTVRQDAQNKSYNSPTTLCAKSNADNQWWVLLCKNNENGEGAWYALKACSISTTSCIDGNYNLSTVQVSECNNEPVNIQCSAPLNSKGYPNNYNPGASFCVARNGQWERYECDPTLFRDSFTGFVKTNDCSTCTDGDNPFDPNVQVKSCEKRDSSEPPKPEEAECPDFTSLDKDRLFGQPGANCGIPREEAEMRGFSGNELTIVTRCCYPTLANVIQPPQLRCIFNERWGNTIFEFVDKVLWKFVYRLPFPILPETWPLPNLWNLKKFLIANNQACEFGAIPIGDPSQPDCTCTIGNKTSLDLFCNKISDTNEQKECLKCMSTGEGNSLVGGGIWTGIGCIKITDENSFIQSLLGLGVSVGGAFSLLCLMYAALTYQRSRGNPETLKKAQDMITSCITGLLLIIFSVFILRLIGYTILRIPGFS